MAYSYITAPKFQADGNLPYNPSTIPSTTIPTIKGWMAPRQSDVISAITSITWASSVATVTTTNPHGLVTGQEVMILGVVPAGYNGFYSPKQSNGITVTGSTTFTFPLTANPGSVTTEGTLYRAGEVIAAIPNLLAAYNELTVIPTTTATASNVSTGLAAVVTGNVIEVTLTTSTAVDIIGEPSQIPTVNLDFNGTIKTASLVGTSSTSTSLVFQYTVLSTDIANTAGQFTIGTSINLNGSQFVSVSNVPQGYQLPVTPNTFTAPNVSTWTIN